jgi:Neuraminidase (sialidase)
MKLLSKEVFISRNGGRPIFPGFVSYSHWEKPALIQRVGWVDASDTYDDYSDMISTDNGKTWSKPILFQKSKLVEGGRVRYGDSSAIYDPKTRKLITITNKSFYPEDRYDVDQGSVLEVQVYDSVQEHWETPMEVDFGIKSSGVAVSFSFPIQLSDGRILIPVMKLMVGSDGRPVHYPNFDLPAHHPLVIMGEFQPDGQLTLRPGQPVHTDLEKSCRGFDENTLVELSDRRIGMVLRGSNEAYPQRTGYKWMAMSGDQGQTWSEPEPWRYTDGKFVESGANGSAIFRSIRTKKIYWIGNICEEGDKVNANWPRSPLVIGEVDEPSFALKRETLLTIDRRGPGDSPYVQMSNFRYYQDRETGDVVVFLSRFGEQSMEQWKATDYYRYRVAL